MILFALCTALLLEAPVEPSEAEWIWTSTDRDARVSHARLALDFQLDGDRALADGDELRTAALFAMAEHCNARVELNGRTIGSVARFGRALTADVAGSLRRRGANELVIHCDGAVGPAAVALRLDVTLANGATVYLRTNERQGWRVLEPAGGEVATFGAIADPVWSQRTKDARIDAFDDYEQWRQALRTEKGTDPRSFLIPDGFEIELLRSARKDEGSWVSLTFDPRGRLLVGIEASGILRMTLPAEEEDEIAVERLASDLREPRGLLFAHGALYVNANTSKTLYRLRDTDGDGRFDERRALYTSTGGDGHGRNALALGPDEKVYAIHGDSPDMPRDLADRTSPCREQRRGKKTREGHLLRFDADGSGGEVVAAGLRNPYGIDFNTDGEIFTYDADAEFDMGASWYRPTRVRHLVSGADYGWRGVTGSWPPYFPESPASPPAALDVGKGSPTGVRFGTMSAFPPRYRRALFILDWAYGRILAVHLAPRGASYVGRAETFLKGRPLNVTDLAFGPDGAMYFVTGGRKTQSALYRVRWTGPVEKEPAPTAQQAARRASCAKARALRRRLERHHRPGAGAAAIAEAWEHLGSEDPWLRHAARLVLEHQPIAAWEPRSIDERRPLAKLTALLALARGVANDDIEKVFSRARSIPLTALSPTGLWIAIHVMDTCLDRFRDTAVDGVSELAREIDRLYPSGDFEIDRDLSLLLAKIDGPRLVPETLDLLDRTEDSRQAFHYLFVLRGVRSGWTVENRERWTRHFRRARGSLGGRGLPTFLEKIRTEFLATTNQNDRKHLESLLASGAAEASIESPDGPPRPFVRKWTVDDLAEAARKDERQRDLARGRKVFSAAQCGRCHRVREQGAAHGPDLTSVASRFGRRDLLRAIIEPSAVIAPKYRNFTIVTRSGAAHTGQVLQRGDYRRSVLEILTDPLEPRSIVKVDKSDVLSRDASETSPMPAGLLDTFEKDEILDLLAFLEAGGRLD